MKGCLFHFTEALRKKFENEPIRLKVEYDEGGVVWQFVWRCVALSFIPDFMVEYLLSESSGRNEDANIVQANVNF